MLRNKHRKLTVRNLEIIIGAFALIKGLWLVHDSQYFFYPPNLTWIMDNPVVDGLIALVGVILIISSLMASSLHTQGWINASKICLVIVGVVALILLLLQLTHGILTPDFRMSHTALGDGVIFVVAYLTACDA